MNKISHLYSKLEFEAIKQRLRVYSSSDLGKRLIDEVSPIQDLRSLQEELSQVTEFKNVLETEDHFPLDGIKDVRTTIQKASIEDSFVTATELRDIFTTQQAARLIKQFFEKRTSRYPLTSTLAEGLFVDRILEYNIDQAIDENGTVKDTASKELREIRRSIIAKTDSLRVKLEAILKGISDQGYAQDEIMTTRDGRMVIPVKVEHKHHVPGFIHSSSGSGATVFIEPAETLEMNNEIRSLQFSEQREVERILRALTTQVRVLKAELLANVEILARLDFLLARAKYSIEILGAQPNMVEESPLRLLEARHPLLLQRHRRDEVVPLSLELGADFKTLIITGPNAGGKTVALKTVGLLSLMAACGLHIPALPDSQIPVFERIFIDIGDEQSIENDLSSFTSHLVNLKQVVDEADYRSLVLIDEIGAGTDPTEGGALAAAILSELTTKNALTIATTHHGALKTFAHETPGFENAAMEFDQATLRPTYRFKCGVPGSSYALEIATRLGLPESIVSSARGLLGSGRDKLESLLSTLEQKTQLLDTELNELKNQNASLAEMIQRYDEKLRTVNQEIKAKKAAALEEGKAILEKVNALVESSIKEIKEQAANKETVTRVKKELAGMKATIESELHTIEGANDAASDDHNFRQGNFVRLKGSKEVGQIVSTSQRGNVHTVEFGNVRMHVEVKNLVHAEKLDTRPQSIPFVQEIKNLTPEIDLRGMTGEEAIHIVDKFLDDASLASLHSVSLIHGKGTGALRNKIAAYLKSDPRVRSSRLGEWNEGGAGVTVVDLRN